MTNLRLVPLLPTVMSLDDLDELASLIEDCRPLFDALPWSRSKLDSNLDCIILKARQLRDSQQNPVQEQVCDYCWHSFYRVNASQSQQKRVYGQVGRSHVRYPIQPLLALGHGVDSDICMYDYHLAISVLIVCRDELERRNRTRR